MPWGMGGLSESKMPLSRRTGRIGVGKPASPSATHRLPGGRSVRGGATSQRIPSGDRSAGSTSRRISAPVRETRSTRILPGRPADGGDRRTLALIGGAVGAVIVVLAAVLLMGGSKPPSKARKKAPVVAIHDASGHARECAVRGEDGLRKAKEAVARYERVRSAMTESHRGEIVDLLSEANNDIDSALMHLEKAMSMGGPDFNPGVNEKKFIEMRKVVRDLLKELQR